MSYRINKTNGDLILELSDGQIDNTTTDVTLVGRNYRGFGEIFNENFIKIVENFASTASPNAPLQGQLWYDTSQERLRIYNGTEFRTAGSPIVSSTRPSLVAGDIWIDSANRKMFFYDGNQDDEYTLVGPAYDNAQGKTGLEVESVIDIGTQERIIIKILIAGQLFAVITDSSFRLSGNNKLTGYPDDPQDIAFPKRQLFEKGINLADTQSFFRGTAESARGLIDADGNTLTTANFIPSNSDADTTGSITIKNSEGLRIGIGDNVFSQYKIIGTTTAIETQQDETDIALRTRIGNQFTTPLYVDSSESKIGIYNTNPAYTLDITGDLHTTGNTVIDGNLTVNGNATYVNVDTLRILDKNIELGLLDDSTEGTDSDVDDAGIIVRSIDGSKDLSWKQNTNSWTSNVNFNLLQGNEYKIDGDKVLSRTELGPTVNTASGLSSIGALDELDVDNINIDGITITSQSDLVLDSTGSISVSDSQIKNLSNPSNDFDATTKIYVDLLVRSQPVYFAVDTTSLDNPSLQNPYEDVKSILESLSPASEKEEGVLARVHCTAYNNASISAIDVQSAMDKQFVTINNIEDPFDLEENLTAESIVQDINFSNAAGTFTGVPTRQTMTFQVSNNSWIWSNTSN